MVRRVCKMLMRLANGFLQLFGLQLIHQATFRTVLEDNQRMRGQIEGFRLAMEQDYLLIRDLFQSDPRLAVARTDSPAA